MKSKTSLNAIGPHEFCIEPAIVCQCARMKKNYFFSGITHGSPRYRVLASDWSAPRSGFMVIGVATAGMLSACDVGHFKGGENEIQKPSSCRVIWAFLLRNKLCAFLFATTFFNPQQPFLLRD